MRVLFSTKNPIETLHLLNTQIPYKTFVDYVEYLDVYEALQEQQHKDAEANAKLQQMRR